MESSEKCSGYVYDKEAILEYILNQRKDNRRKMKEWERQKNKEMEEQQAQVKAEEAKIVKKFKLVEGTPAHPGVANKREADDEPCSSGSVSNMVGKRKRELPSFWLPSQLPLAKAAKIDDKPDQKVYCPMSGNELKVKELFPIKFTPIKDGDTATKPFAKKVRNMCPVTFDALTNKVPTAVLRTSGNVVTVECVEKIIKKDWIDPTNGKKVREEDIMPLQRGGTGFAATNQLDAKKARPVMELQ